MSGFTVNEVKAREILDSRGRPTVEVDLLLSDSSFGRSSAPSGASVGVNEAIELRDGAKRYGGKGVLTAINNVNTIIAGAIVNCSFADQNAFDSILISLDGTKNKSHLGANALLPVSIAFAKAVARANRAPLFKSIAQQCRFDCSQFVIPTPMLNILNGGKHGDNHLDIQEFMIIPTGGSKIEEKLCIASEVFYCLRDLLRASGFSTNIGDEGGFAPNISSAECCLDLMCKAIANAGYTHHVKLALDVAASTFYKGGEYHMRGVNKILNGEEMIQYYKNLITKYPIISIEDPLAENDIEGWRELTKILQNDVMIVGDDIFVTNKIMLRDCVRQGIANAVLIKLNQVGTLTETVETIKLAKQHNYTYVISHRSGETEDTTISHLAVATRAPYIKAGSICRTDRICKYNELIRIAELI
ncbi:Enolase [Alphaproteobacteria bacterium]